MDIFLKRLTLPQKELQAGPSGGVPEVIVIIAVDSVMHVIVPEDLPVGQGVEVETVLLMVVTVCRPGRLCVCVS